MQSNAPEIILQTHDDSKVLSLVDFEKFGDSSGYRCRLVVSSGGFMCDRPFYFDDSHFPDAIVALRQMAAGTPGEAIIKGQWDDDHIKFVLNELGHVIIMGQMHEHAELSQSLTFGFRTDQTVLGPLVRDLLKLQYG